MDRKKKIEESNSNQTSNNENKVSEFEDFNNLTNIPESSIEKGFDTSKDVFDDVFGEDEEREEARKRMREKINELLEKRKAKEEKEKIILINQEKVLDEKIGKEKAINEDKEFIEKQNNKMQVDKLELKYIPESEEETIEPEAVKLDEIEKTIVKSVIKNKARLASIEEKSIQNSEKTENLVKGTEIKESDVEDDFNEEEFQKNLEKRRAEFEKQPYDPNVINPKLSFLMADSGHAYIGRKKSVLKKYGEESGLFIGRVEEKDLNGTLVYMDGLNPHVVFACGARGTGKSYVLGVIAEELALKNKNVGIVVIDPIGVFWSMKYPNKEEKELELLAQWGIMPQGLDNVKVFIPIGMKDKVPKNTFDAVFSIQPSLLTAEDWCLTFGIDRFSPTGLLMEKGIMNTKKGYTTIDGRQIRGKENTFSLDDLIYCFENDSELNDKERGYKADSIRALVSRFDAAKNWGIFDEKGTPLGVIASAGQMSIIDTSFLEDNVSALVVGIFARRLLAARKLSTRREAAGKFGEQSIEDLMELNVPPTWLFIDEAHTLIPGGNQKTPASNALIEYVKQGRRPGCSLVFATQQPSAIDPRVLSQLDIILVHKLVFDDDIKSIQKRMPTIIPHQYKKSNFIKTLSLGIALVGDRQDTTSRAFVMAVRPRMSQHEGREAETIEIKHQMQKEQVEVLAVGIIAKQLEKDPAISIESVEQIIAMLNKTYKQSIDLKTILNAIKKKGFVVDEKEKQIMIPEEAKERVQREKEINQSSINNIPNQKIISGSNKESLLASTIQQKDKKVEEEVEENVELIALSQKIDEETARKIALKFAKKKMFGLLGYEEIIDRIYKKFGAIYKVKYNYISQNDSFKTREAYINSLTGEFIHDVGGKLRESKGLIELTKINESEADVLRLIEKGFNPKIISKQLRMEEGNVLRIINSLVEKEFVGIKKTDSGDKYFVKVDFELPETPLHEVMDSIGKMDITEIESAPIVEPVLQQKEIPGLLKKLWGNVIVKEITEIYLPLWEIVYKKTTGEERIELIDAINGNKISRKNPNN